MRPLRPASLATAALFRPWLCPRCRPLSAPPIRSSSSSSSSTRWQSRQSRDPFAAAARTASLKSRAAYKLLAIDARYRLFARGASVVDLGYAPGAWSQVAVSRVQPGGRVVGVDVIPAQPPRGASTIQGNFLSAEVQDEVRRYVGGPGAVDVVLSDMSAPWVPTSGMWLRSVSNPFFRMMNTSGIGVRDHAGSMDLCNAALGFCFDTLKPGGHFVCKFYQGAEDKALETRLKKLFEKVVREKPDASRKESKEAFFVAMRRKPGVERTEVFGDGGGEEM